MDTLIPIFLVVLSFGLIVLEVFVPSFGILTIAAVVAAIAGLYLGFGESVGLGAALLATIIVGVPAILVLAFKVFPDTPIGRHMMLIRQPSDRPAPATRHREELVGREGVARSDLRPSGVAFVEGERLDVVTRGEMVDVGSRIRIIETRGNRIVVRAVADPTANEEGEAR